MYGLVAGNVLRHAPLASFVEEILAIIFEVCELRRIALGLLGLCQSGLSQKATDVYKFRVVKFHVAYFVSCGQMFLTHVGKFSNVRISWLTRWWRPAIASHQDRHIQYSPALKLSRKQELRFADLKHCLSQRYGRGDTVRSRRQGSSEDPQGGRGSEGQKQSNTKEKV